MKSIILFTHSFPFNKIEESFLSAEIEIASKRNIDLTIIPLKINNFRRDLPENIKINTRLAETSVMSKIAVIFKMLFNLLFWKVPFQDKHSPRSLRQLFYAIKYLYGGILIKHFLSVENSIISGNAIIYSYWFNHTSLGAVLAKLTHTSKFKCKIITRGHGFDVYEDEVGMYFPYRELNLKYIDHVYTVSKKGKLFLISKYPKFKEKISVAKLGTIPIKPHNIDIHTDSLSFLSCSSIIPIKRVDLIFRSVLNYASENPHKKIKWTHIGAGAGYNNLQNQVKRVTIPNFNIELKGFIENKSVRDVLENEDFNIFINLSASEGVPVSIMEAISVGIPILATKVGGNDEIVTAETGLLISRDFDQTDFSMAINKIIVLGESLRKSAHEFYMTNFNAEDNYSTFYERLINL